MAVNVRPVIVAAPDSFKGSCEAIDAAHAMLDGARAVFGDAAEYVAIPLADGGEGTLDAMLAAWGVDARTAQVHDAIGRPRTARYGLSPDGNTAIVEAAEANGLPWVSDVDLRPLDASTEGVGEIVLAALDRGATSILLCIGGSATSDGGTGMLRALGVHFLDAAGREVPRGAAGLSQIERIDASRLDPRAKNASWRIAVDVNFPLTGPRGAAAVFGPQKGATQADIEVIDAGLAHLAALLASGAGIAASKYTDRPGFGAAGGMPLTGVALLDAETIAGADLVSETIGLPGLLAPATLVLTGEGRLDSQSVNGKVIDLVVRSTPADVPVVVIAGSVALSATECRDAGVTAAFSIAPGPTTLEDLIATAPTRIAETAEQVCRLYARSLGLDSGR
ncbi:glycerate kinase [Leucobacter denitrificans]|uniref:Glycerate kinase n=1 Tax=Leucobacter denitrificans TaxID=683042 RepID=A0A7G9S3F3_9MICO|nr:glycerate kinase [Leucobacter denitrificans]QNN62378.1 glycerate kinase [Leucobacter denitrificans]